MGRREICEVVLLVLLGLQVSRAQTGEVTFQHFYHWDYTIDVSYFQEHAIPRILYAASSRAKNTRDLGGFYAIDDRQGHLFRIVPLDPDRFGSYSAQFMSVPGVLAPVIDRSYAYRWPLGPAGNARQSQADLAGEDPVVTLVGQPGDTVYACRDGVVLNRPSGGPLSPGLNTRVDISHPDGGQMRYLNLDPKHCFVGIGDRVVRGQPLGRLSGVGQLELVLTTLDTVSSPYVLPWEGMPFRNLYTHVHVFHFASEELPGSSPSGMASTDIQALSGADFYPTVDRLLDVHRVADQVAVLAQVRQKWLGILGDSTQTNRVLGQMTYGVLRNASLKYLRNYMKKDLALGESVAEQCDVEDIRMIREGAFGKLLNFEGFVHGEDLMEKDTASSIWDELAWYDIRDGMWVAEIGAGEGLISYVLACHYPALRICYQDIEPRRLDFGRKIYETDSLVSLPLRLYPVWGKKKDTRLESFRFDRIIIRDAFHHFKKKEDMLASIRKSMDAGSQLIINEPMGELDPDTGCDDTLTSAQIRQILLANGLAILEEHVIEEEKEIWFRCRLRD